MSVQISRSYAISYMHFIQVNISWIERYSQSLSSNIPFNIRLDPVPWRVVALEHSMIDYLAKIAARVVRSSAFWSLRWWNSTNRNSQYVRLLRTNTAKRYGGTSCFLQLPQFTPVLILQSTTSLSGLLFCKVVHVGYTVAWNIPIQLTSYTSLLSVKWMTVVSDYKAGITVRQLALINITPLLIPMTL